MLIAWLARFQMVSHGRNVITGRVYGVLQIALGAAKLATPVLNFKRIRKVDAAWVQRPKLARLSIMLSSCPCLGMTYAVAKYKRPWLDGGA